MPTQNSSPSNENLTKMSEENAKLKRELQEMKERHERDLQMLESKVQGERSVAEREAELVRQRNIELEAMKTQMVKLTRKLDDEVTARDQVVGETQRLERKLQELSAASHGAISSTSSSDRRQTSSNDAAAERERGTQVSTKLMRVVDQWMRQRDLQQALLRNSAINDMAFATLAQALVDCCSLQTLDLSQNLLTMDSCSDVCQLITTSPRLSFVSLAENLFSLRSVGYFMTAVMERQTTKRLVPLDLLDLQGNEGLQIAIAAPPPEVPLKQLREAATTQTGTALAQSPGPELVAHCCRALWRFLHDTSHPQVRGLGQDDMAFDALEQVTLRKMDTALMKILLLGGDERTGDGVRPVTANLCLLPAMTGQVSKVRHGGVPEPDERSKMPQQKTAVEQPPSGYPQDVPVVEPGRIRPGGSRPTSRQNERTARPPSVMDPFADLKSAFEPAKDKLKTFNLKQIITRNGTVLMNMLERLLETTEIDAVDVESDQTLLEYACITGNMGLAKLCYRRGANLSARTKKGDTALNIVTRQKRYDLMEFLHNYGVKVSSCDADGRTALHVAAANDDVDGICRLVEWGADVNIRDNKQRTPIHLAAAGGKEEATKLLLELGADMNAKDNREYTAVAHAEGNNHFKLMDRLVQLGGKGHGLHQRSVGLAMSKSQTSLPGGLVVSAGMLKSSSLGRIGKVSVKGMPGPILPQLVKS
eukprot:TRINITY_DN75980_c0_g1_i1.p1 TRINITY_DN75980_c0_g1~~TRINITY_DN75980_c0_g1_i1.p1  ORF type:complete len:705 (-),score=148.43 TRINITY_DN75980_c0_g1_i1:40-2154(-)